MADLPVPKAEAKPSIPIEARAVMARLDLATRALPRDVQARVFVLAGELFDVGVASGRAQVAADIRAHVDDESQRPDRRSSSHLIEAWLREAALIAEGSDGTGTDRDETTLPASTTDPDPRADTEER